MPHGRIRGVPQLNRPTLILLGMVVVVSFFWSFMGGQGNSPLTATPAVAQTTEGTPPPVNTPAPVGNSDDTMFEFPTIKELFDYSPIINSILGVLSIFALLMFVYFVFTISPGAMAPTSLVDEVTKLVISEQYDQVANLCRNNRHVFIASIVQRCVENSGKEHSVIMDMIDTEGRRRADIMWNRISYLADVSNVAPMLGLLGTILGMIKTFFLLPKQPGNLTSGVLAEGIGGAMSTTMFGLIVGISALVLYSIVKARATKALAESEQVVHSVADHIKRGGA